MKPIPGIILYGNQKHRDKNCPSETVEQITLINRIRSSYPDSYGKLIVHIKNEGKLINGQFSAITKDKAMGMVKGAPDIFIPGMPSFLCEIKRQDRTISKISEEQIAYLLAAKECGAFVCVALGCDAAWQAFSDWLGYSIHIQQALRYKKT